MIAILRPGVVTGNPYRVDLYRALGKLKVDAAHPSWKAGVWTILG